MNTVIYPCGCSFGYDARNGALLTVQFCHYHAEYPAIRGQMDNVRALIRARQRSDDGVPEPARPDPD